MILLHHTGVKREEIQDINVKLQDRFEETAPLVLVRWDSGRRAEILAPFDVCWVALDWLGAPATPELIFMARCVADD